MIRIQGSPAKFFHRFPVQKLSQFLIGDRTDFLNLMGSPEAVEEMKERNTSLDRRQMRYSGQIHDFLYASRRQHGKAGLPAVHDIAVISED